MLLLFVHFFQMQRGMFWKTMSFIEFVHIPSTSLGWAELELGERGERGAFWVGSQPLYTVDLRHGKEKYTRGPGNWTLVKSGRRKWQKEPSASRCPGQSPRGHCLPGGVPIQLGLRTDTSFMVQNLSGSLSSQDACPPYPAVFEGSLVFIRWMGTWDSQTSFWGGAVPRRWVSDCMTWPTWGKEQVWLILLLILAH